MQQTENPTKRKVGLPIGLLHNQKTLSNNTDQMKIPDIENKIKKFVQNLKSLQCNSDQPEIEKICIDKTQQKIEQQQVNLQDLKPLVRKQNLNELLNEDQIEKLVFHEKKILQQTDNKIQLRDLLQKDKPAQIFVNEIDEYIFIVIYQEVTFLLFAIEKSDVENVDQIDINFMSQVKMQFQVIYQEQSHSEKLTCCESALYYPSVEDEISQPSLCFLLGGNIGEIFILKDNQNSFQIIRRQVCTGQIQQIVSPEENSYFQHKNICLVLSQLEHIYLFNFTNGIIVAQFGYQGSTGPGKFLSVSWHNNYEYFLSARENGGIELWKIDQTIINHISEAYHTQKQPGQFFRKYVDMPFYYTWGIHVNQTGALVFSSLIEHILVTIDNNMILRFTALEIKNSDSHINIATIDLKLQPSDIVNVFVRHIDVYIVTKNRIIIFTLSETANISVEVKQVTYAPNSFNHIYITQDYKYVIGLKENSLFLCYQNPTHPS